MAPALFSQSSMAALRLSASCRYRNRMDANSERRPVTSGTGAGSRVAMSTEELLRSTILTPDPAMYRPRPSSHKTQDISHLLTSIFKNVYTGEIIGKDTGANLILSKGGDNPHHQKFVKQLQQIRAEYDHKMAEADKVERHIIQARARATAEEEHMLQRMKSEAGETYQHLGLPPVESYFRWCVDNNLLKKHQLISPEDYITDPRPVTKAPRGFSEPSLYKETFTFHQHVSRSPVDDGYCEPGHPESPVSSLLEASSSSSSSLTLLSTCDAEDQSVKKSSKKSTPLKKKIQPQMSAEEREAQRAHLVQVEKRHNFLKNPRFSSPTSTHGGRSLILPPKKREVVIAGRKRVIEELDENQPVPVFLANPPVVFFPEYEVGQIYEMTVELRNMTASSRHVRIIPPSTPYFSVGLGKFPGEGGIVAPGMSCHYTVRFVPDSLSDFEDYMLVETQAPYPVLVPIEARRPPPILTLPRTLDCGPCLAGGVKIFECLCRNEGLSRGSFCIMPKSSWPPANFRSVATAGFVEQPPFGIRPAMFELYPGQETVIEVVFFPSSSETYSQVFTIVCDNCQVKDLTLTGYGQHVGLEVVSVSGMKGAPCLDELPAVGAEQVILFPSTNVHSTAEKSIVIRNTTHVELPFYWQIMKPNLQDLIPGQAVDWSKIEQNIDANPPFLIRPVQGMLLPYQDHTFNVTYTPNELTDYHNVAQMVLCDIPDHPSEPKRPVSITELAPSLNDVIILDLEFKGSTEPFHLVLEPYAIIFSGESFIDTTMRKHFKMWNHSKSPVCFEWDNVTAPNIIQTEPHSGTIEPNTSCEFELLFTGLQAGFCSENVSCRILHSEEPVVLHVEATFKGPVVSIPVPSLDLGLMKLGNKVLSTFAIENLSPLTAKWKMSESRACVAERGEEKSPFSFTPDSGVLPPLGTTQVSVLFNPLNCQRLQTVLELEVENGEGSYLPVAADVQIPQVCLLSSCLVFDDIYIGVPAQASVKMFNQGHLPATFSWKELTVDHPAAWTACVTPESGVLGPNEEAEMCVTLTVHVPDELDNVNLCCWVEDMKDPLLLNVKAKAQGLQVTYSRPAGESLMEAEEQELLLDFGSEVLLQSTAQQTLILTNHTGISAPFTIQAAYFSGCPPPQVTENTKSPASVMQRMARFAEVTAKRKEADMRASFLSDGKGAAFIAQPSSGILGPFQEISITVTAYNNMWGEYSDQLVCTVGDLKPKVIPVRMTVKGCPIYFQMTGPRTENRTEGPTLRFGTHLSGGDTISRCLRINNPSPFDIRIDWETYNREQESSKFVDLLMLYGDPFPLKDMDGNEIIDSSSAVPESGSSSLDWDKIPSTSGTTSSVSLPSSSQEPTTEASESGSRDQEREASSENKLISLILRAHEGTASDYPYCITPTQTIVPANGFSTIHVSFTPLMLSGVSSKVECSGFALGFLSLDDKSAKQIPGRVKRQHGYGVEPIKMELQAYVKPALLTVEVEEDEEGLVFYSVASDLIPDKKTLPILTEFETTRNLKLTNCSETPLYFRLLLSKPFSISAIDPKKSVQTSHSDREEQGEHVVLYPQQNTLVKVSFGTTLELLTYQHLAEDQLLPGVKLLQSENGERRLHFSQQLLIEYSNKSTQHVALSAFVTVPVLQLSCDTVDFGTCFVGQPRTQEVFLLNKSGSKSFWTALLDKRERHSETETFSISPTSGMLEAHVSHTSASKEMILITFTARTNVAYETGVTVHGMLGEKPLRLIIKGRGSYDEKYEVMRNV